ncbi:MAG: carbamoyltransferase [Proteobacteria bacterium]|nr:carbamoyltransferase [Pseudomonadota bacterium]
MSSHILGVSAFYHDSAAALLKDGEILAAAQEERFTRIKHDRSFPKNAVDYCLREAGISTKELEYVVYYDKPLLTFDRLFETYAAYAPRGFQSFRTAMPPWMHEKLHLPREIDKHLNNEYEGKILFCLHHLSHAASAFYPSPFESAAVITADGVGEWSTASIGVGRGSTLKLSREIRFPHSLGLLYSAFTYYLGFKVNSGEYKVMGLAPYGEPKYFDKIVEHLIDVREDGSFHMDMKYFNYCQGLTMTSPAFHDLFGGAPRGMESKLEQKHMDLAASVQKATNEIMLKMARFARTETGEENLCMAGGVALNCVANGLIEREKIFKRVFVQPAAGDAGGSLGAALFAHYHLLKRPRNAGPRDAMRGSFLGPKFSRDEILRALYSSTAKFTEYPSPTPSPAPAGEGTLLGKLCELLESGAVIGLFQGRMEFGPRALGARSIIGDPRNPEMQSKMNLKIKFRESFRPFAPAVLEEDCPKYFELDCESPYMLLVAPVREELRKKLPAGAEKLTGIELLKQQRSTLPAITHVDHSARVQTVTDDANPFFAKLLRAWKAKTGCGVLVNTSFNVRGEPIVGSPADAIRCFLNTEMDALVVENFILLKPEQTVTVDREKYLKEFALD